MRAICRGVTAPGVPPAGGRLKPGTALPGVSRVARRARACYSDHPFSPRGKDTPIR